MVKYGGRGDGGARLVWRRVREGKVETYLPCAVHLELVAVAGHLGASQVLLPAVIRQRSIVAVR